MASRPTGRLIVNSGTSCYADSPERLRQRGSTAHNTLVINNRDSSEVWKSFRVARRAKVFDIEMNQSSEMLYLKASHDGYYYSHKIYHTRVWRMLKNKLLIEDQIDGSGLHKIDLFFYFHPNIMLKKQENRLKSGV